VAFNDSNACEIEYLESKKIAMQILLGFYLSLPGEA
jgi:hypothetical protein